MPRVTRATPGALEALGAQLEKAVERLWAAWHPVDRDVIDSHGLTPRQWTLLRRLCESTKREIPMGSLATHLGLTPSGVTRCADPLVVRGLVERVLYPGDRRVCCLKPTETGLDLWRTIVREATALACHCLQHLTPQDSEGVVRAVELLAAAAEEEAQRLRPHRRPVPQRR